jgi:iron complex outermembrane receptor protein
MRIAFFSFALMLGCFFQGQAQSLIQGQVSDCKGSPIAGAIVSISGTFIATSSDSKGNYKLKISTQSECLVEASMLGFVTSSKRITPNSETKQNFTLQPKVFIADEVVITATRAGDKSAMAYTTLSKKEIADQNLGQDMPMLLNNQPSVVVNSDAGTGIGYTGIRVRGSDPTRTNVTVNGIPMNDAESHGLFWVNMPDFASSVSSIQLQRGVGTSTNGAGAFGATLNMQTNEFKGTPYANYTAGGGSFNTFRNTLEMGTGLVNGFTFDLRLSKLNSDGFIDRSTSDLKSFFLTAAWYKGKSTFRANVFSGKERTGQAWYGVPQDSLETNPTYNPAGSYYNNEGKEVFYDNQTDNYQQDHYQFFVNHQAGKNLLLNAALHYTKGFGYYEEYMQDQTIGLYGMGDLYFGEKPLVIDSDTVFVPTDTISNTSLVRRRWLDNRFYGTVFSATFSPSSRVNLVFGGGWNQYKGQHFGEVTWAEYAAAFPINYRYYQDTASKTDFNVYTKANVEIISGLDLFADFQYRTIRYSFLGYNEIYKIAQQEVVLNFINPKLGLTWDLNSKNRFFSSYSIGNREPVRDDYTNSSALSRPLPENLQDLELGYRFKGISFLFGLTGYYMQYKNQLVLTGALNDVGAASRINTPESYRAGIELEASWNVSKKISWQGNVTLSRNKIKNFTEYISIDDTFEQQIFNYSNTDISFSPNVVGSSTLTIEPIQKLRFSLISKYVGKQFLDNTQSELRKLDAFTTQAIRINWNPEFIKAPGIEFALTVNNILDVKYSPNGATYPAIYGGVRYDYNYYFTQAGRNILLLMKLKF